MYRFISRSVYIVTIFAILICFLTGAADYNKIYGQETNSAGFYVHAHLPKNQIKSDVSYFDLLMKPSQEQKISVEIFNEKDEDVQVEIGLNNASTNANGLLDYTRNGIKHPSMVNEFEEIASVSPGSITVKGGGNKIVDIDLKMPPERFHGDILGGIVFTEVQQTDDTNQNNTENQDENNQRGMNIVNRISYAVAVKLSETNKNVDPDFKLERVAYDSVDYKKTFVNEICNTNPKLITGVEMDVEVKNSDNETVISEKKDDISIAPNSIMPYPITVEEPVVPGEYASHVQIRYTDSDNNKQAVDLNKNFQVTDEQIKAVDDKIPNPGTDVFPLWAKILIPIVIALIISVIVMIVLLTRRKDRKSA